MTLIDNLINQKWLKTPTIIEAFRNIKRVDFLSAAPFRGEPRPLYGREEISDLADLDRALPIGFGQTISQPLVVAFMLELLQPKTGDKILDVGSGSGWTSALLAEIVGKKGKVIAIELIPELKEFGKENIAKYNFIEKGIVECIYADGTKGYEKEALFDKILCSAAAQKEIPLAWKEQLKIGGRIVSSVDNSIWLFIKKSEKEFEKKEYPGFALVPLVLSGG